MTDTPDPALPMDIAEHDTTLVVRLLGRMDSTQSADIQAPLIDRITSTRQQGRGYAVQGYVAADVGPRTVTYSFSCDYDGRYANVDLN